MRGFNNLLLPFVFHTTNTTWTSDRIKGGPRRGKPGIAGVRNGPKRSRGQPRQSVGRYCTVATYARMLHTYAEVWQGLSLLARL